MAKLRKWAPSCTNRPHQLYSLFIQGPARYNRPLSLSPRHRCRPYIAVAYLSLSFIYRCRCRYDIIAKLQVNDSKRNDSERDSDSNGADDSDGAGDSNKWALAGGSLNKQ